MVKVMLTNKSGDRLETRIFSSEDEKCKLNQQLEESGSENRYVLVNHRDEINRTSHHIIFGTPIEGDLGTSEIAKPNESDPKLHCYILTNPDKDKLSEVNELTEGKKDNLNKGFLDSKVLTRWVLCDGDGNINLASHHHQYVWLKSLGVSKTRRKKEVAVNKPLTKSKDEKFYIVYPDETIVADNYEIAIEAIHAKSQESILGIFRGTKMILKIRYDLE